MRVDKTLGDEVFWLNGNAFALHAHGEGAQIKPRAEQLCRDGVRTGRKCGVVILQFCNPREKGKGPTVLRGKRGAGPESPSILINTLINIFFADSDILRDQKLLSIIYVTEGSLFQPFQSSKFLNFFGKPWFLIK